MGLGVSAGVKAFAGLGVSAGVGSSVGCGEGVTIAVELGEIVGEGGLDRVGAVGPFELEKDIRGVCCFLFRSQTPKAPTTTIVSTTTTIRNRTFATLEYSAANVQIQGVKGDVEWCLQKTNWRRHEVDDARLANGKYRARIALVGPLRRQTLYLL